MLRIGYVQSGCQFGKNEITRIGIIWLVKRSMAVSVMPTVFIEMNIRHSFSFFSSSRLLIFYTALCQACTNSRLKRSKTLIGN